VTQHPNPNPTPEKFYRIAINSDVFFSSIFFSSIPSKLMQIIASGASSPFPQDYLVDYPFFSLVGIGIIYLLVPFSLSVVYTQ
jgi:hypothetical protein